MENIEAALKEAEKVAKRQRACASKTVDSLDKLILEVTEARKQLSAPGAGVSDVFNALGGKLTKENVVKEIADNTKELHGAVNKLGKVWVPTSQCKPTHHVAGLRAEQLEMTFSRYGVLCEGLR